MTNRTFTFLRLFLALLLVTGLVTGCAPHLTVNVNAIANNSIKSPGSRYVMVSDMSNVDEQDLYFREFSRYFQHVLQKQGYTRVADIKDADMEIRFRFGLSDGRPGIATYSWPIYESIGGDVITVTEQSTDSSGNPVTTTRTIRIPSRIQRVGTSVETRSYTLFNKTAGLEARLPEKDGQPGEVLWMVSISSVSTANDLRGIMPYLAAATAGYIGQNTGEQREIVMDDKDPLVLELKKTLNQSGLPH
jgi:hypothetical protein